MVESMDENIGRVLKTLKTHLEKDTLVIFFSDNGGLCTGSGPNMPTSGLPLRAGKAWLYEGGIRVPLIIKFPGKLNLTPKSRNQLWGLTSTLPFSICWKSQINMLTAKAETIAHRE